MKRHFPSPRTEAQCADDLRDKIQEANEALDALVEKLKARRMSWVGAGMDPDPDCQDAAAAITTLRAENAALKEAPASPGQRRAKEI